MKTRFARLTSTVAALLAFVPGILSAAYVIIDPGHGGKDQGAVHGSVKESELVLAFSAKLETSLKRKGYQVALTRDEDTLVTPANRALLIPDRKPVVVISLHISQSKDPAKRGFQILTAKDSDAASLAYEDRELPKRLAAALEKLDPRRPVKAGKLGKPYLDTPKAIILEVGYMTNDADRQLLTSETYQQQVADIVAETINNLH
jgi:N-acetylmuramoyl-L-alanine amidase